MATQLLVNVLTVTNLAGGGSVTLAHGLRSDDQPVTPTQVLCDRASPLVVSGATSTSITVTNPTGAPLTANFRCEYDHSIVAVGATPVKWSGVPFSAAGAAVYGQFSDNTNQNLSGVPLDLKYNTVDGGSGGITVAVDPTTTRASRLTVATAGTYAFTISPQLEHFGGGGAELVRFYAVANTGTVPNSASYVELSNNNRGVLPFLELILPMSAGGWVQWWMAGNPGTNIRVQAVAAAAPAPAAPSVIAGVKLLGT